MNTAMAFGLIATAAMLSAGESTISLSPAAASLKGKAGLTYTQPFTIRNGTNTSYSFKIHISDVVVQNGKRSFVRAGEADGSVAAMVSTAQSSVTLQAGESATIPVTFVIPQETSIRAVAVFFTGEQPASDGAKPATRLSLGAVVDFTCSDVTEIDARSLTVTPPTVTTNATFEQQVINSGAEPYYVGGVVAILTSAGKLAGKADLGRKRFLPGEVGMVRAEFPGALEAGTYRALFTIEYAGKTVTTNAEFNVP